MSKNKDKREYELDQENLEEVMKKYAVAGAAFWRAGLEKDGIWDIILKYVQ